VTDLAPRGTRPIDRRRFLAGAGLFLGSQVMVACGSGPSRTADPGTPATPTAPVGTPTFPPAADVETELLIQDPSGLVDPGTIEVFRAQFGIEDVGYETTGRRDELPAQVEAGIAEGDLAVIRADRVPALIDAGSVIQLDPSRLPNLEFIGSAFKARSWDPLDAFQVPKAWGATGILARPSALPTTPQSWRDFHALITGVASEKVVFVDSAADVFAFALLLLGYPSQSVEPKELDEARRVLLEVAPHVAVPTPAVFANRLLAGTAVLALGWPGVVGSTLMGPLANGEVTYVLPEEGSVWWLDSWVIPATAAHPNAAYTWLNFIHEPEIQAGETNHSLMATANDAAREFVDPEILAQAAIFPPDAVRSDLEDPQDTSGARQRADIYEEFRQAVGG
jgi:spermidine/putrescine-binding protein